MVNIVWYKELAPCASDGSFRVAAVVDVEKQTLTAGVDADDDLK